MIVSAHIWLPQLLSQTEELHRQGTDDPQRVRNNTVNSFFLTLDVEEARGKNLNKGGELLSTEALWDTHTHTHTDTHTTSDLGVGAENICLGLTKLN